jgi:hypothetical protein
MDCQRCHDGKIPVVVTLRWLAIRFRHGCFLIDGDRRVLRVMSAHRKIQDQNWPGRLAAPRVT